MREFALPHHHLTARVPWHDTGWDGRVCRDPAANTSCQVLRNVAQNKDTPAEQADAGLSWDELKPSRVPPCAADRAGWLRPYTMSLSRSHPYARRNSASHGHLLPTDLHMPAWAVMATPYRWMLRENAPGLAARWGLEYRQDLEDLVDAAAEWEAGWVQHHTNQAQLLDAFFSAVRPGGGSLLFVYAKDVPLVERDENVPGRKIVAVTTVQEVQGAQRYRESRPGPTGSVFWERPVLHGLRTGSTPGSWNGGVVLPYHQLLTDDELVADGLERFVAVSPADRQVEFSYGSELLSHDGAVDSLLEVARAIREAAPHAPGDWATALGWIDARLAEVWSARGAFPGIGSALAAAGVTNGALVAHEVAEPLPADQDPWPVLFNALEGAAEGRGPLAGRVARGEAGVVTGMPEQRMDLLRLLSRMDLSPEQAKRLFRPNERDKAGIDLSDDDLLANPWLAYEVDRGKYEPVAFRVADRAAMVEESVAAAHPLPTDPPVEGSNDPRRVRAAFVDRLETAATADGDTLLPEYELVERANAAYDPPLDATSDLVAAYGAGFDPALVPVTVGKDGERPGWQLDRLARDRAIIRGQVHARVTQSTPLPIESDWATLVDAAIDEDTEPDDDLEVYARTEKAEALRRLATNRFTALVGPAGTGKTTLIKALRMVPEVANDGILLLAPTGKAVVQLTRNTGLPARTIASFLYRSGRFDGKNQTYRATGGPSTREHATVVIDEASMVTEPMLAAVLDAVGGVKRLVLAGDHRQLPPIGEGRPFADAVALAGDRDHDGGRSLAELTVIRRQNADGSPSAGRDDLRLAAWFASDTTGDALDDTIWSRLVSGNTDPTLQMMTWDTVDDLEQLVSDHIEALVADEHRDRADHDRLFSTWGFGVDARGYVNPPPDGAAAGAERWQILSPVRHRPGGVAPLNEYVQNRWLHDWWPRRGRLGYGAAAPAGPGRVTHGDKVIVTQNRRKMKAYLPETRAKETGEVANGEVGLIWGQYAKRSVRVSARHVWLTTQPDRNYTVWDSAFGDDGTPLLDAAYALTVHKAQGSQFDLVFLVVPDPCPLTSPELLYTALTRQTRRVVLMVQGGDPSRLRAAYGPVASATAARLTNLFGTPDPVVLEQRTRPLDRRRLLLTDTRVAVRSKSEVIVGNALTAERIDWAYEVPFPSADKPGDFLLPDFTIEDDATGQLVLWEHLGMMDRSDYRARWQDKVDWYRLNGVLPLDEGGGPRGALVWSTEQGGLDSNKIRQQARRVFGG